MLDYIKEKRIHIINIVLSAIGAFSYLILFILIIPFGFLLDYMDRSESLLLSLVESEFGVTFLILFGLAIFGISVANLVFGVFGTIYAGKNDYTIGLILYIVGFFVFPCKIIAAALCLINLKKLYTKQFQQNSSNQGQINKNKE
ncbi:Hypothetical protein, predicted transmembrane protein [Metamycoplasma auris 15026]|uniref:Uncharacterized protein n=1 Tax=Metamycoplasma auris 15026 TaxID=1188233 RepID=N9TTB6_9BACT|nr:hypothetical protein [Metamycoplasma auris]ENY69305.1 Hypothetical protein, predicted transmembrane protein [Metamycoplasma auris 15026]